MAGNMSGNNTNINDNDGGGLRERTNFYTNPIADTQSQGSAKNCPVVPGFTNNPIFECSPKININTPLNTEPKTKKDSILPYLLLVLVIVGLCLSFVVFIIRNSDFDDSKSNVDIPDQPIMKVIDIENPETFIANKLIEINDMINFANCLKLRDAKALVEQYSKDHKNSIADVRIEIMDVWLKRAEVRYWNELVEALKCAGNDRLAAQIEDKFIK